MGYAACDLAPKIFRCRSTARVGRTVSVALAKQAAQFRFDITFSIPRKVPLHSMRVNIELPRCSCLPGLCSRNLSKELGEKRIEIEIRNASPSREISHISDFLEGGEQEMAVKC